MVKDNHSSGIIDLGRGANLFDLGTGDQLPIVDVEGVISAGFDAAKVLDQSCQRPKKARAVYAERYRPGNPRPRPARGQARRR